MTGRSNPAEQDRWEQASAAWVEEADDIALMTRGATEGLISALLPCPGERILDLACGPGDPSLELARRVGPRGRILATDAVATMVDALQRRAREADLHWLETSLCPAQELTLEPASFDGACCRFGAMFFTDLPLVLGLVQRALVPGGRAVFVVWGAARANPHFTATSEVLNDLGVPAPDDGEQLATVFELAEPGALAGPLAAAGFVNVEERPHDFPMVLVSTAPEQFLERQLGRSAPLADRFERLSSADQARARQLVAEKVAPFADGSDIALPARCLVLRGEAPR